MIHLSAYALVSLDLNEEENSLGCTWKVNNPVCV